MTLVPDDVQALYPDGVPLIIEVAYRHGLGAALIELKKRVYYSEAQSLPGVILEAVEALCLSSCTNQYCSVMHSRGLMQQGFSLSEVRELIEFQRLPRHVENRAEWEHSLRRIVAAFREPDSAEYLYRSLAEFHSAAVIAEIAGVVSLAQLHKVLLDVYGEEIRLKDEPLIFARSDHGAELIEFFESRGGKTLPVYRLCSICKDVHTPDGWVPVESTVGNLREEAIFSHGVCDKCIERWKRL